MGATDSNSNMLRQQKFDQEYKLVRRYTCACYGQLTVIQNKLYPKQYLAMKEFVSEESHIINRINGRKTFKHPNLVNMVNYWICNQSSICSNLKKINLLYEYYEKNLEDQLNDQIETTKSYSDSEITDILWQFVDCLNYLEQKGIKHLIGGLKSIKMHSRTQIKLLENEEWLLYDNKNTGLYHCSSSKRTLPLHPSYQLNQFGAISLTNQSLILQNIFTIGIILLGLCHGRDPNELDIITNKGSISFEKLQKCREAIIKSHPDTANHLTQMLRKNFPKNIKYENFIANNENTYPIKDFKLISIPKIQKTQSNKRLSQHRTKNIFK